VVVLVDESARPKGSRDQGSGDSGVTERMRLRLQLLGRQLAARRRVLRIDITGRVDLIDAAMRLGPDRPQIPILMPDEDARARSSR
jgi:SpoVK/Ycf46/Vps4 family AAA+-type ATPase